MIEHYGFIYFGPGTDSSADRVVIDRGGMRTTIVPVAEESAVVQAAVSLVDDGVQLLELCGFFGPVWTSKVIEAIDGRVPVGAVSFGAESVARLHAATAPTT